MTLGQPISSSLSMQRRVRAQMRFSMAGVPTPNRNFRPASAGITIDHRRRTGLEATRARRGRLAVISIAPMFACANHPLLVGHQRLARMSPEHT